MKTTIKLERDLKLKKKKKKKENVMFIKEISILTVKGEKEIWVFEPSVL